VERYRLAPAREMRSRDERIKRGELASAASASRASEADVATAAEGVELARTAIDRAVAPAMAMPATKSRDLVGRERFLARLRRDLDDRKIEHAHAVASHAGTVAKLDGARQRLARSRADREVIERHFERWRSERAKLADRRED
jgi:hypothetical protein